MKNKLLTKCFNFKSNLTLMEDILVRQIEFHLWLFFLCVCIYIYLFELWLTMFQMYSEVIQLYIYIYTYIYTHIIFEIIFYYRLF